MRAKKSLRHDTIIIFVSLGAAACNTFERIETFSSLFPCFCTHFLLFEVLIKNGTFGCYAQLFYGLCSFYSLSKTHGVPYENAYLTIIS